MRRGRTQVHENVMPLWLAEVEIGIGIAIAIGFCRLTSPIPMAIAIAIPMFSDFCFYFRSRGAEVCIKECIEKRMPMLFSAALRVSAVSCF